VETIDAGHAIAGDQDVRRREWTFLGRLGTSLGCADDLGRAPISAGEPGAIRRPLMIASHRLPVNSRLLTAFAPTTTPT
jgi:hypothetical protein